jgi:hypothetical protein
MEARVHTMDKTSRHRPIDRNIFNTNGKNHFRPISLDEILNMLVRYEGAEHTDDLHQKEKIIDE